MLFAMLDPEDEERVSQGVGLPTVAIQFMLPPPLFKTAKLCAGTIPPPSIPTNVKAVSLSRIVGAAGVTSRLTVTVRLSEVTGLETVIMPVWTPKERPAELTVTCVLVWAPDIAKLLEGENEIHGLAGSPCTDQGNEPPPAL